MRMILCPFPFGRSERHALRRRGGCGELRPAAVPFEGGSHLAPADEVDADCHDVFETPARKS